MALLRTRTLLRSSEGGKTRRCQHDSASTRIHGTVAMPLRKADWEPNKDLPVGKGATIQQFFANVGKDQFEINVAPWGEGQLKVNGLEIARTAEAKDRRQAFASLKQAAERYIRGET